MYAVVRRYQFDEKFASEIDREIKNTFVPLIKKAQGFVAYYWMDSGKGTGISMSVFQAKAGAEESVQLARDYVQKNLSGKLGIPEVISGEVKAHG